MRTEEGDHHDGDDDDDQRDQHDQHQEFSEQGPDRETEWRPLQH